jgi:hypothetical protein
MGSGSDAHRFLDLLGFAIEINTVDVFRQRLAISEIHALALLAIYAA